MLRGMPIEMERKMILGRGCTEGISNIMKSVISGHVSIDFVCFFLFLVNGSKKVAIQLVMSIDNGITIIAVGDEC